MKITKDNAYIILTPNVPGDGDVGLEMINYTDDPNVIYKLWILCY
jgi:hypothetical protein